METRVIRFRPNTARTGKQIDPRWVSRGQVRQNLYRNYIRAVCGTLGFTEIARPSRNQNLIRLIFQTRMESTWTIWMIHIMTAMGASEIKIATSTRLVGRGHAYGVCVGNALSEHPRVLRNGRVFDHKLQ